MPRSDSYQKPPRFVIDSPTINFVHLFKPWGFGDDVTPRYRVLISVPSDAMVDSRLKDLCIESEYVNPAHLGLNASSLYAPAIYGMPGEWLAASAAHGFDLDRALNKLRPRARLVVDLARKSGGKSNTFVDLVAVQLFIDVPPPSFEDFAEGRF